MDFGELMFFFCYFLTVGRLIIIIIKVRNLKVMDIIGVLGGILLNLDFFIWF